MKEYISLKNVGRAISLISLTTNVVFYYHIRNEDKQAEPITKVLASDLPQSNPEFQRAGVVNPAEDGTPYWRYYEPDGGNRTCLGVGDAEDQTKDEAENAIGPDPTSNKDTGKPKFYTSEDGKITLVCADVE